jgi:epoxyqueuosine reductase
LFTAQYRFLYDKEDVLIVSEIEIITKALELGYDKCGIIPVQSMLEYESKLDERIKHFPESKEKYDPFRSFSSPHIKYPWAKAIIVCTYWYGKYRIPENLYGAIGKYYLTDCRSNINSEGYKLLTDSQEGFMKNYVLSITSDKDTDDTNLYIKLPDNTTAGN